MKAIKTLAPEELFVSVPRAAALVVEPKGRCPCPDFVNAEFWKQAPWPVKMGVLLLREAQRGRDSPVWGYISQLPETIDTPVRWTDAEVAALQYQPLQEEVLRQREQWRQQYDAMVAASKGLPGASVTWERFLWALENVRSRAFSGPYAGAPLSDRLRLGAAVAAAGTAYVAWAHLPLQQALNGAIAAAVFNLLYDVILSSKLKWYALCPVIDAVNHSSKVESKIEFEYFQDTFVASTSAAYGAGEQVFISYGTHSNDVLLQYYGFVEPGNAHDTYAATVPINGRQVKVVVTAKGTLTPGSLAAARDAMAGGSAGERQLPGAQEAALQEALAQGLAAELAGKETSVAEDEKLLSTVHLMGERAKAAALFRVEKKKVLQRGVERAKKRVAKLKGEK